MNLPPRFLEKMKQKLELDYDGFLASYNSPRVAGLRANRLKISPTALQQLLPFLQKPVPWSKDGFYYQDEEIRPAKSPYYYAGLYYIQEPSAMYPAELLQAEPGEKVLDLCAAPGGKSLQLAAQLGSTGLLVVNDLNSQRAKVLLKNMERYGVRNVVVLNETPEGIAENFPNFFNKILVDAPCSGEGMFRKEPEMVKGWSEEEVAKYSKWQKGILNSVPSLIQPGGEVVYSTCTFSKEENEEQIDYFLSNFNEFELLETKRLWPHEILGEGHFMAKMRHKDPLSHSDYQQKGATKAASPLSDTAMSALMDFSMQVWRDEKAYQSWLPEKGELVERSGHILWESLHLPSLSGLKVLRSGWLLGTMEKGRFKPSQAFALGLPAEAIATALQKYELSENTTQGKLKAISYLRGETLQEEGTTWDKGWYLISIEGYGLGWAKAAGHWLKNEYPPGWRWMD